MAEKQGLKEREQVTARAVARYIRISPYKARKVMDLIRGKEVEEAQRILAFSPTHASRVIGKVLNSAVANAENNQNLRSDELVVQGGWVDEGPTLKRWMPRARGRATRIRKRTSHITIVLGLSEKRRPVRKGRLPRRQPRKERTK
jgi:large subunit ribosomal protein L22